MQPGNEKIVADRIYNMLSQKRSPKSTSMTAPAAMINGRWDVNIEFFSSKSQHTLFIEQDGNWIQGSHKGDFSTRELTGTIEGDVVKLRSVDRHIADHITFIFSGTLSNDTFPARFIWENTARPGSQQSEVKIRVRVKKLWFPAVRHWQHR